MYAVRALPRPIAVVLALMLALLIAVPLMGAKGGNAPGAKACQKGGYAALATSEDAYTAFPDQDACVAYAAQGGTLTALVVVHGSAQFVWVEAWGECDVLLDAMIPGGASAGIEVQIEHARYTSFARLFSEYPAYAGLPLEAGATMTSAVGIYNLSIGAPFTDFPVTFDPEPCGPGSTAG
jgi:hypothetical protein